MALFNSPKSENYPRKWAEMSLDCKLMFLWHCSMMVLFLTGGFLTLRQELGLAAILMVVLFSISMRNRSAHGWQWRGVEPMQALWAGGSVLLTSLFLYAASPEFSPADPRFFPWYLAGFGIGTVNFLALLQLVRLSESQFLADCQPPTGQPQVATPSPEPADPAWQRFLRGAFTLAFLSVWMIGVTSFYLSGKAIRDGSPTPTATHTDPVNEHGHIIYVTHKEKLLDDSLMTFTMIGIPSVMAAGAILHFLVGVKLFPNAPTLKEYLNRKT